MTKQIDVDNWEAPETRDTGALPEDMDDNSDIEKEKELEDEGRDLDRQAEIFNNEYI